MSGGTESENIWQTVNICGCVYGILILRLCVCVCVCVCVLAITFPLPVVYCLSSRGFAWGTDSSVCSSVIIINTRLSFPGHQLHTLCQAPWLIQTHKVPLRVYKWHDVLSNWFNINPSMAIFNTQRSCRRDIQSDNVVVWGQPEWMDGYNLDFCPGDHSLCLMRVKSVLMKGRNSVHANMWMKCRLFRRHKRSIQAIFAFWTVSPDNHNTTQVQKIVWVPVHRMTM